MSDNEQATQEELDVEEITVEADEVEQEPQEEALKSERQQTVQAILASNKAERGGLEDETPEDEQQEDIAEDPGEVIDDEPETVTVIINGEEREASREKVEAAGGIRAYQTEQAAQAKFEQASHDARAIKEREQVVARREALLEQAVKQLEDAPPQTTSGLDQAKQLVEMLLDENDDEAAKGIATIIETQEKLLQQNAATNQELQQVKARQVADAEKVRVDEMNAFFDRNQDIERGTKKFDVVARMSIDLMREQPGLTPVEHFKQVELDVRELFGEPSEPDERKELKRSLPKQPKRAGGKLPGKEPPKPLTTSEIIARAQKRRGQ